MRKPEMNKRTEMQNRAEKNASLFSETKIKPGCVQKLEVRFECKQIQPKSEFKIFGQFEIQENI